MAKIKCSSVQTDLGWLSLRSPGNRQRKSRRKGNRVLRTRAVGLILIFISIVTVAYLFWPRFEHVSIRGGAAIIDSFYSSSPEFTDEAVTFLFSSNVSVDVYKDENVTVELFRKLPRYGYSLIILRVHTGIYGEGSTAISPGLFTNEPYNTYEYVVEQMTNQICPAVIGDDPAARRYFAVTSDFVNLSMEGNFNGSLIVLSSCLGLWMNQLSEAMVHKGARAFIGWDEKVALSHTDKACMLLLRGLIQQRITINQAVGMVMTEIGPDPTYGSKLKYYPEDSGNIVLAP
jgi:uncharacterized protein CbrC (UPF0167 family)